MTCPSCGRPTLHTRNVTLAPDPHKLGLYTRDGTKLTPATAVAAYRAGTVRHHLHRCDAQPDGTYPRHHTTTKPDHAGVRSGQGSLW